MSIYSQITSNKIKSWLVMIFFVAFVVALAYLFGQASGSGLSWAGMALVIAGLFSLASYYFSDSLVLSLAGAKKLENTAGQDVYDIVENLSLATGIPKPKVYLLPDQQPNAFATGRDPAHAVVCVSSGLLRLLNKTELEGVIAHELSHIQNFDTRLAAIVVVLVGLVAIMADLFLRQLWWSDSNQRGKSAGIFMALGLILALISPLIAQLIQLAISRRREFLADANGALLTRYPAGLAAALEKISQTRVTSQTATHATAHLYLENPFRKAAGKGDWLANLFNTHPPVEERIRILRSM